MVLFLVLLSDSLNPSSFSRRILFLSSEKEYIFNTCKFCAFCKNCYLFCYQEVRIYPTQKKSKILDFIQFFVFFAVFFFFLTSQSLLLSLPQLTRIFQTCLGHTYLKRYFFPQSHKDAIIVDERDYGGGQAIEVILKILMFAI